MPRRDPTLRYERERPGELLHVDIKKLGRFFESASAIRRDGINRSPRAGWQYLHVAIDDHSRLAYCELLRCERKDECAAFLRRAVAWYREQGIVVERVLTDNAKAYHSHLWRDTCSPSSSIGRRYTRPYSPWTNGKAEALIKTLLREWAYRFAYPTSAHRARALSGFSAGTTDADPTARSAADRRSAASHTLWSVHLAHSPRHGVGPSRTGRESHSAGSVRGARQRSTWRRHSWTPALPPYLQLSPESEHRDVSSQGDPTAVSRRAPVYEAPTRDERSRGRASSDAAAAPHPRDRDRVEVPRRRRCLTGFQAKSRENPNTLTRTPLF